mmetsp:Transcript_81774/g.179698  ORF Transcript_81774/g.179698 Transcript_81774/m.179698 type:complete len:393 (-) Transcript_81774:699-1877(-)|eukprot:CAMPEP_0206471864 /NCGR_PEP_ID=MMETSP0324_2-20121206/31833_1 /ASSEMBLY_ACC=CAM_ASM_000836 /TAXON_ID=2866 /ORGANISM="Crypthecodinium cohnii, Strain Seligo" /LENGTH=392 /DNA_ID=CAMNT_0053946303 /DNA_START=125 /DNA_END=1303 /DNA_ORIENTATION=+
MPRGTLFETLGNEHPDEAEEDAFHHLADFTLPPRWANDISSELAFGIPLRRSKVVSALGGGPMLQASSSLGDFLNGPGDPLKDPQPGPIMVELPEDPSLAATKIQHFPDDGFNDGVPSDDVLTAVGLDREFGTETVGPDGQVMEYWSVEGPDGHIKSGHEVHHIRNGHVVAHHEEHHDSHRSVGGSSAPHQHHQQQQHRESVLEHEHEQQGHAAAVGSSSRHHLREPVRGSEEDHYYHHQKGQAGRRQREDEEQAAAEREQEEEEAAEEERQLEIENARHRAAMRRKSPPGDSDYDADDPDAPQGPLDADPGPGVPIGGSPDDVDNGDAAPQEESNVTPSVLLGGAVAMFAQVYLWSNVFVTLFKAPPRTNQEEAAPAAPMADSTDGDPSST